VPSVASEAYPILPLRPLTPSARSLPEPDAPATPFADLLDSAAPDAPTPAPRQALAERAERNDPPKPGDEGGTDAKPVQDNAQETTQAKDSDAKTGAATGGNGAKIARDTADAGTAGTSATADTSTTKDGDTNATADAPVKTDTDPLIAQMLAMPAPPATVVAIAQPLAPAAVATTETPEAEALVALQAAGGLAPNAPKPGSAPGDKAADAPAKTGAPAYPQAGVPQIDPAKDGQARGNGDKTGGDKAIGEFHRAIADLLTKPEASASPQQGGDAGGAVKASADAVQNLGLASPANSTTPAASVPSQPQAPAQTAAVPLSGLAVEITTQAHAGNKHFEIRLDPPELGRIDVKLDVDRDGNVSTRLVVDRSDTLDLLKRDASALERALQQSGLKTSDNALEFSLRQQGFARDDTAAQTGAQLIIPDDDPAPLEAMRQGYGRLLGLGGGLDIRV
jgi:flagellar hook-length control protein FliK